MTASHDSAQEVAVARAAEEFHTEIAADLRASGATMAEIHSGLAFVDAQLREIDANLARLQKRHRRLDVLVMLSMCVLMLIAWTVIAR